MGSCGSVIDGAIVEKNCRVGAGVKIVNQRRLDGCSETAECMIVDGIVVIQRGATLPDGWWLP